jgi:cyclase
MTDVTIEEVANQVWAYVQPDGGWMINNTGIIGGGAEGHLLIDTTSTETRNRNLFFSARELTGTAEKALINTHHHGDHTYGNWLMPPNAPIISSAACRADTIAARFLAAELLTGPEYGHLEVRAPDVTFDGALTVHLGGRVVELLSLGPAHTAGDVIAWLPAEKVVFVGDIAFTGGHPFLIEGSLAGYLRAVEAIRRLGADVIVPGHGPVRTGRAANALLDDMLGYARYVQVLAEQGVAAGLSPLQTARGASDIPYTQWREGERLVANLARAFDEIAGGPLGRRLELLPIWTDMVNMHGGPITSHA